MRKILYAALLISLVPSICFATSPAPLSGGAAVHETVTIGTVAVTALAQDGARKFLQIQNTTNGTNGLACTIDGSTPVIGGNGIQLAGVAGGAGGSATYDSYVPTGAVKCIGSASGTVYTILYQP